jgi:hypothetical protein
MMMSLERREHIEGEDENDNRSKGIKTVYSWTIQVSIP